jgi:hypothetical protein
MCGDESERGREPSEARMPILAVGCASDLARTKGEILERIARFRSPRR